MRTLWQHTAVVLLLALLGCTSKPDTASSVSEDSPKSATEEHDYSSATVFGTPESCWNAMVIAEANQDVVATLECLAVEDRHAYLGTLAYQVERLVVFQTPLSEKALELLRRYGFEEADIMGALQAADTPSGGGVDTVLKAIGREIKDQSAFAKEAVELVASIPEPDDYETPALPALKLSNVIVSGDTATGVLSADGSLDGSPIHFVREEGSWRMSTNPMSTGSDASDRTMP